MKESFSQRHSWSTISRRLLTRFLRKGRRPWVKLRSKGSRVLSFILLLWIRRQTLVVGIRMIKSWLKKNVRELLSYFLAKTKWLLSFTTSKSPNHNSTVMCLQTTNNGKWNNKWKCNNKCKKARNKWSTSSRIKWWISKTDMMKMGNNMNMKTMTTSTSVRSSWISSSR